MALRLGRVFALLSAIAVAGAAAPALCASDKPVDPTRVIGDVHLRQSIEQVRAKLPAMEVLQTRLGAAYADGPAVRRFAVRGVTVPELKKPIDLELRFWNDQLWVALFYYKDNNLADVRAALEKRYGDKPNNVPQAFWSGPGYMAALQPTEKWYSLQDPELSATAQRWFLAEMGRKVDAAPTPGAAAEHEHGAD